jgi:hypothetical protein
MASKPKPGGVGFDDQTPFWGRRGFLFALAAVALIGVLLVVVLVATSGTNGTPEAGSTAPPAADAPASPSSSTPAVDEGPTAVPTTTPEGIRWEIYGGSGMTGVALPASEKAGPRQVTASTATGYAHTPLGALLAASNIPFRKLLAPAWQDVVTSQIVPGPGRDAFAAARAKLTDTSVAPGQLGQLAAFKFVNYSESTATIQLVSRFTSGTKQVATITVLWSGGDWKEVLQPNGADSPTTQKVADLIGYVPWGGV